MVKWIRLAVAGACAGTVSGLFGAGGGMVLVPLLSAFVQMEEERIFPASVAVILPICLTCLLAFSLTENVSLADALPYLPGSLVGGLLAGKYGERIPAHWLHRGLGVLILWGGIRYLC